MLSVTPFYCLFTLYSGPSASEVGSNIHQLDLHGHRKREKLINGGRLPLPECYV